MATSVSSRHTYLPAIDNHRGIAAGNRLAADERRKPKRIVIFCNGDIFFKGKRVSIMPNRYLSYHDLLQDLTHRMPGNLYLPNGVRQLFSPCSGRRINEINDIKDGSSYVCAGNETFKPVKYGVAELTPWGKGPSVGNYDAYTTSQVRFNDTHSTSQMVGYNAFPPSRFLRHQRLRQSHQPQTSTNKFAAMRGEGQRAAPKVITVVKDGARPRPIIKILLNKRGIQSFQQLLNDISESFGARSRKDRIKNVFTVNGREVRDVGDFFRDDELFVAISQDFIHIDQVADLLEELYPKNPQTKVLVREWEKRLKRSEKRQKLNPVKQSAGLHIEERDSGYDESDLTASDRRSPRVPSQQAQNTNSERVVGRQRIEEVEENESKPRRQSVDKTRHLPLLHDPQQEQQKMFAEAELNARLRAEAAQRSDEEKKLKDEARQAKKHRSHKRKQHEQKLAQEHARQPFVSTAESSTSQESTVSNKKSILPPIPSQKDIVTIDNTDATTTSVTTESKTSPTSSPSHAAGLLKVKSKDHLIESERLSTVREEDETKSSRTAHKETSEAVTTVSVLKEKPKSPEPVENEIVPTPKSAKRQRKSSKGKENQESAVVPTPQPSTKEPEVKPKSEPAVKPLIRPISSTRHITDRYELGRTMGDGNFAIVRACKKKNSSNEYAMKIIDKSKLRGKEQMVINEVRIMKMCNHPNIVKLKEEFETRTEIYLVMELVKGGDLFDAISQAVKFNEGQAAPMVRDMADSLFYLHSRNIVHRDMKPENLLVYGKDGKKSLKLGDFGLAMEVDRSIFTVCGTPTYVAPEILMEQGYGLEVDLWAMGVITYILLCGFPPFRSRERRQTELFDFIKNGAYEFLSPYWDHISNSAKDLIQNLLIVDRKKRYTAVDVLTHPWIMTLAGSIKVEGSMPENRIKRRQELEDEARRSLSEFRQLKLSQMQQPSVT